MMEGRGQEGFARLGKKPEITTNPMDEESVE